MRDYRQQYMFLVYMIGLFFAQDALFAIWGADVASYEAIGKAAAKLMTNTMFAYAAIRVRRKAEADGLGKTKTSLAARGSRTLSSAPPCGPPRWCPSSAATRARSRSSRPRCSSRTASRWNSASRCSW
jgi:hypothetical protein